MWMWVALEIDEDEPLTKEERESIKIVTISPEDVAQDLMCAICLIDFVVDENARELSCGGHHKFHEICLFTWLENKRTCPVCREHLDYDNDEERTEEFFELND